ncbi:MAG: hypothetical protein JWN30_46 [Bacilli bacterium]|nr:hypothetical protein [Bacilli bacterium]
MSVGQLEELSEQLLHEQNEVMKELLERGWGRNIPDTIEDSDMKITEDDF